MTSGEAALVLTGGFVAGFVNAIAGGGTLVSFPTLLALGRDPVVANATNAVALFPGAVAGAIGFRSHVERTPRLGSLVLPSFAGAVLGALLLLRTSPRTFAVIVPYLIVMATSLFLLPDRWVAPAPGGTGARRRGVGMFVLALAGVYGGYFGAGLGIIVLATLGMLGIPDLHERNGIKNLIAAGTNGIAAVLFAAKGAVVWADALVLSAGAVTGGYVGAHVAQRLGRRVVRSAIIAIGFVLTVWYFAHPSR